MTSYILKNNKKSKDILLFEEKESYSFTPKKKTYKWVKKNNYFRYRNVK